MTDRYLPPDHWSRSLREVEVLTDIARYAAHFLEKDWPEHIECNLVDLRKAVEEWLAL